MTKELGDRFKAAERSLDSDRVPEGGFLIIRLDGKAFHTFTRNYPKPFSAQIAYSMAGTLEALCRLSDVPAMFGYTQSDEISLVVDQRTGQPWMGGRVQKIVSVSAAYATAYFNRALQGDQLAVFDGRVLHVKDFVDVHRYLLWRKADANRNALSAVAQAHFPHKELQGKKKAELFDMIAHKAPQALPIVSSNFNGRYMYPVKVFVGSQHPVTGEFIQAQRTRWMTGTDDKMLNTFLNTVDV